MSYFVADKISRRFGEFLALDDVTLSIGKASRHALIGPNGAGKSTLFNILAGQVPSTAGRVWFDGTDITKMPVHERALAGISRTFQRNNLFARKTVFENVRLAVQVRHFSAWSWFRLPVSRTDVLFEALDIVERLSLDHLSGRLAGQISYGDQRRVELAIALAGRPKIVLLDEPAAGIGRSETRALVCVLAKLPLDLTIVIVEHDLDVVSAIADTVTVLQNGRIIATGKWQDVQRDEDVKRAYIGSARRH